MELAYKKRNARARARSAPPNSLLKLNRGLQRGLNDLHHYPYNSVRFRAEMVRAVNSARAAGPVPFHRAIESFQPDSLAELDALGSQCVGLARHVAGFLGGHGFLMPVEGDPRTPLDWGHVILGAWYGGIQGARIGLVAGEPRSISFPFAMQLGSTFELRAANGDGVTYALHDDGMDYESSMNGAEETRRYPFLENVDLDERITRRGALVMPLQRAAWIVGYDADNIELAKLRVDSQEGRASLRTIDGVSREADLRDRDDVRKLVNERDAELLKVAPDRIKEDLEEIGANLDMLIEQGEFVEANYCELVHNSEPATL